MLKMGLDSCAPLDISGAIYCKDFLLLPAHAFVSEVRDRETAGWIVMR